MARMIPAAERVIKARKLIQKARDLPVPPESGRYDLGYIAQVKSVLQDARDMVKYIPYTPTASAEMKADVALIFQEIEQAEKEILRGPAQGS